MSSYKLWSAIQRGNKYLNMHQEISYFLFSYFFYSKGVLFENNRTIYANLRACNFFFEKRNGKNICIMSQVVKQKKKLKSYVTLLRFFVPELNFSSSRASNQTGPRVLDIILCKDGFFFFFFILKLVSRYTMSWKKNK